MQRLCSNVSQAKCPISPLRDLSIEAKGKELLGQVSSKSQHGKPQEFMHKFCSERESTTLATVPSTHLKIIVHPEVEEQVSFETEPSLLVALQSEWHVRGKEA